MLIADSSLADRNIFKKLLENYQADIVSNAAAALDLFDSNDYDVVLLDSNLDDTLVSEVVEQIRQKEQLSNLHVPIVVVCGTVEQEEALRGIGISKILIKGRGFLNRDILLQTLLRCVSADVDPPIESMSGVFESDLVDSVYLAHITKSSFFRELFELFIGCTQRIIVHLTKYSQQHDTQRLVVEAHNCSSISSNIGAVWLSKLAQDLRVEASIGWSSKIPEMVDAVIYGVNHTFEHLQQNGIVVRNDDGIWQMSPTQPRRFSIEDISPQVTLHSVTKVCVVDDMTMTQFIVVTLLSKFCFSCDAYSSADEAIASFETNNYDFVLMDVYMEGMNGIDAAEFIRRKEMGTGLRVPIIGVTSLVGDDPDEVANQVITAGMDDVIFKPILRNSFLPRLEIWRNDPRDAFCMTPLLDDRIVSDVASTGILQQSINSLSEFADVAQKLSSLIGSALGSSTPYYDTFTTPPRTAPALLHTQYEPSSPTTPFRSSSFAPNSAPASPVRTPKKNALMVPVALRDIVTMVEEMASMLGASRLAEVCRLASHYAEHSSQLTAHVLQRIRQIYSFVFNDTIEALKIFEPIPRPRLKTSSQDFPRPPSRPPSILVVEDQAMSLTLIAAMLVKAIPYECTIDTAVNGEVAVQMTHTKEYDLILMDICMPELDGFRATHQIREYERSVHRTHSPVVAMASTGSGIKEVHQQDIHLYQEAGIHDLIHKPFTIVELQTIVTKYALGRHSDNDTIHIEAAPVSFAMPAEMMLNEEILDMLRGLNILERTIRTFEKHSKELIIKAREVDPTSMSKRTSIRQSIHALKGISLNSGASMMGKLCDDMERIVLECDSDTVLKMLDLVEESFDRSIERFADLM